MASPFTNHHLRGDFYFRDVFQRNRFSSFKQGSFAEDSSVYVTDESETVNCTSQISTLTDGIGELHIFARNQSDYAKSNVAQATVSVGPLTTRFRSSRTRVDGEFLVGANVLVGNVATTRVGINCQPQFTLDVNGDCNIRGNVLVNGASVPPLEPTAKVTYGSSAPFLYLGPGATLSGLPFFTKKSGEGLVFVTALGESNSVFTFAESGTFLVQVDVVGGYPWLPEGGGATTAFVLNEDRVGVEAHAVESAFHCSRCHMVDASAGDTLRFLIESLSTNDFSTGIQSCRISFLRVVGVTGGLAIVGNVSSLTAGTAQLGNVSTDVLSTNSLTVGGALLGSSATYTSPEAFVYTGPGVAYANGVPFFSETSQVGTSFVTGEGPNASVFTFTRPGTYLLQTEIQTGYPNLPEGDITSYYVKNGDITKLHGVEQHAGAFITRSYMMTAQASDNVRFVIHSSTSNDFEAGIQLSRMLLVKMF